MQSNVAMGYSEPYQTSKMELYANTQSIQSEVADSLIDPKSMHDKFYCSELHFYLLIAFNVFWKLHGV